MPAGQDGRGVRGRVARERRCWGQLRGKFAEEVARGRGGGRDGLERPWVLSMEKYGKEGPRKWEKQG